MMESNITVGDLSAFIMYAAYVATSLNGIVLLLKYCSFFKASR